MQEERTPAQGFAREFNPGSGYPRNNLANQTALAFPEINRGSCRRSLDFSLVVTPTDFHTKKALCEGQEEECKVGSVRKAYPPVNVSFHQTNKLASKNRKSRIHR
jgi:hypothetical protein